ncbi:MAG: hypothetical protein M0C28_33510 [Candidatus Moduliflexus flocculans]|nr:hypothetical protein [Candidatus Moduliflexus flocculans]
MWTNIIDQVIGGASPAASRRSTASSAAGRSSAEFEEWAWLAENGIADRLPERKGGTGTSSLCANLAMTIQGTTPGGARGRCRPGPAHRFHWADRRLRGAGESRHRGRPPVRIRRTGNISVNNLPRADVVAVPTAGRFSRIRSMGTT